jgi:hypothetical protein
MQILGPLLQISVVEFLKLDSSTTMEICIKKITFLMLKLWSKNIFYLKLETLVHLTVLFLPCTTVKTVLCVVHIGHRVFRYTVSRSVTRTSNLCWIRIRIHWIRIRIRIKHFKWIRIRIRIQCFDNKKLKKKIELNFFSFLFLIKNCNLFMPRPPQKISKIQEKPWALKKEHPAL